MKISYMKRSDLHCTEGSSEIFDQLSQNGTGTLYAQWPDGRGMPYGDFIQARLQNYHSFKDETGNLIRIDDLDPFDNIRFVFVAD